MRLVDGLYKDGPDAYKPDSRRIDRSEWMRFQGQIKLMANNVYCMPLLMQTNIAR